MEEVVIISVCLFLNAILAAYEMAFVSVQRPELRKFARSGNKYAKTLLSLRDSPERTLSIIQIGITMVGAIAAAVGGAGASDFIEPYLHVRFGLPELLAESIGVIAVVIPITYLSVVVGELVPKTLALRNPTKIALAGAKWLLIADRILSPLVTILEWSTKKLLTTFFKKHSTTPMTQPSSTIEIDAFSPVHQAYILNMTQIERRRINDIMLHWSQVTFIRIADAITDVNHVVLNSGHTRLPVIDNGRVAGILHGKEFAALKESGEQGWQSLIRPALTVKPSDSALSVMRMLQKRRSHMAIVLSDTGELVGMVTLEDILEQVVGEIYDEDDDDRVRKILASKARSKLNRSGR